MNLVSLTLCNFLSYGAEPVTLAFEGLGMACLTGPNGHGKSALLDALAWCLWGEATREAKQAGLLHTGAGEMYVEVVFDQDGGRFRVRRAQKREKSTTKGQLDVFVRDGEAWRQLTEPTIAATQRALEARLGLSYDTFVNSVYLRQGHASEFNRAAPARRKELLSEILSLKRYAQLADMARDERRDLEGQRDRLDGQLSAFREQLVGAAELRAELAEAVEEGLILDQQCAEATARWQAAAAALEGDARLRNELRAAIGELSAMERVLEAEAAEADRCASEVARGEQLLASEPTLVTREARLVAVNAELEHLGRWREWQRERQAAIAQLDQRLADWLLTRAAEEHRLTGEVARLECELAAALEEGAKAQELEQRAEVAARLRQQLSDCANRQSQHQRLFGELQAAEARAQAARDDLRRQVAEAEQRRIVAQQAADTLPDLERAAGLAADAVRQAAEAGEELEQVASQRADLKAKLAANDNEFAHLKQRKTELEEQLALLDNPGGACPTCARPLSDQQRERLVEAAREEVAAAKQRGREIKAEGEELATRVQQAAGRQTQLQPLAGRRSAAERERADCERRLEAAREAVKTAVAANQELADLLARQESDELPPALRSDLDRLATAMAGVSYDSAAHRQLQLELDGLGAVDVELDRARRAKSEANLLGQRRDSVARSLAEVQAQQQDGEPGAGWRSELAVWRQELADRPWPSQQAADLEHEAAQLSDCPLQRRELEAARASQPDWLARAEAASQAVGAAQKAAEQKRSAVAALEGSLGDQAQLATELEEAVRRRDDLAAEQRLQTTKLGALRGREEVLRETEKLLTAGEAEHSSIEERLRVVQALYLAFGRDGIPALLMRAAAPEIERLTNEILDQLTDYRMSVQVELSRTLASGQESETLEIIIRDELGSRPYQNYSGGEAFRVDFALRLALSRLVAHRAGQPQRMLFIDEGFGTQDEQGLEQLVQAIWQVRNDYDLVLVVTHLAELKDRFGTRIEVEKLPEVGSTLRIEHASG